MTTRRPILERVVFARNKEELAAAYADWAEDYDSDLVGEMGYAAPLEAAALLHEHVKDPDARILDAGCGTGLVGKALAALGHTQVDGLDFSAEMLAQARKKGVYRRFMQADLTRPLGIDDAEYASTVCVGTLNLSHVGPGAISELVRVTGAGGPVCFTVREEAWVRDPYDETIAELEQAGACRLLHVRQIPYIEEEARPAGCACSNHPAPEISNPCKPCEITYCLRAEGNRVRGRRGCPEEGIPTACKPRGIPYCMRAEENRVRGRHGCPEEGILPR